MEVSQLSLGIVATLIVVALAFDFMNGFHDAANSIATVVSTRVLTPYQAVALAATFNFVALFVFQLKVAATVGRGIADQGIIDHYVVFGALVGAISWNIITWWYGIPSSSSHALIGGIVGAAVAKAGTWALIPAGIIKVVVFIFISPALGFVLSALLMLAVAWLFRRATPSRIDRWFRRLQLVSASLYSLGHGGNDAQKTAGIIWMLLIAAGYLSAKDPIPMWVVVACYITIALGIPVSTTHTITGSIVGVGSAQNVSAVRWGVAGTIVWAWILTIPCSAFIAGITWYFARAVLAS